MSEPVHRSHHRMHHRPLPEPAVYSDNLLLKKRMFSGWEMDLKWIALIALIIQNSGLAIVMRYTFIMQAQSATPVAYITSTAVLNAEIMKFAISLMACLAYDCNWSLSALWELVHHECVENRVDFFKLTIPSMLYTVQNSLQYFSMSCLSAAVFQVLYQMKIITTAVFSVILLAKRLQSHQWISILALAVGVALVQLSQLSMSSSNKTNSVAGLVSVLLGCLTSGFAGVYFEMVLKSSKASIWLRNIQLSMIGMVMGSISCYMRDGPMLLEQGYFIGYNNFVWGVIVLQAAGGLLVAMVVKYADNVLKGFATSISILLSAVVSSMYFHDITINKSFCIGAIIVLASVYLYGYVPAKPMLSSSGESKTSLA